MAKQIRVEPVAPPPSLDGPQAEPLRAAAEIDEAHHLALWGNTGFAMTARAFFGSMAHPRYVEPVLLLGYLGGRIVGFAWVVLPRTGQVGLAEITLVVHPDHRGQGAGTALLTEVRHLATARGRTTLAAFSEQVEETDPTERDALVPTTNAGALRRTDPAARFALARGWVLDQVERHSVLPLPVEPDLIDPERPGSGPSAPRARSPARRPRAARGRGRLAARGPADGGIREARGRRLSTVRGGVMAGPRISV